MALPGVVEGARVGGAEEVAELFPGDVAAAGDAVALGEDGEEGHHEVEGGLLGHLEGALAAVEGPVVAEAVAAVAAVGEDAAGGGALEEAREEFGAFGAAEGGGDFFGERGQRRGGGRRGGVIVEYVQLCGQVREGLFEMAENGLQEPDVVAEVAVTGAGEPQRPVGAVLGVVGEGVVAEPVAREEPPRPLGDGGEGPVGLRDESVVADLAVGDGLDAEIDARRGLEDAVFG